MQLQIAELKHRFFPAQWRVRCLEMLDNCDAILGEELCWPGMKDRVRLGIMLTNRKRDSKVADTDLSAANLVLSLVADLAEHHIIFGHNHVYRGILSFEGKSYRSIVEIALRELYENEWIDHDQLYERLGDIDDAVKGAG